MPTGSPAARDASSGCATPRSRTAIAATARSRARPCERSVIGPSNGATRRPRPRRPGPARARRGSAAAPASRSGTRTTVVLSPGATSDSERRSAVLEPQLRVRDGVAVRVVRRVAERRVDPRLELLREHVLEPVGLGVHLVERHAEAVRQEQLEQPVMPQHLERDAPARLGQRHAAVRHAHDEPVGGELLRHRASPTAATAPSCAAIALVLTPSGRSSWRIALR